MEEPMMDLTRSGIILCTERYEVCVDFYRRILGLPELFSLDRTLIPIDQPEVLAAHLANFLERYTP